MPDGGEITRLRFAPFGMTCGGDSGRCGDEIGRWEGVFHGGMVAGKGDFSQWEEGSGGRREGDEEMSGWGSGGKGGG